MKNPLFIEQAFINGEFISHQDTFEVLNPALGTAVGHMPNLTVQHCRRAIDSADQAWKHWCRVSQGERSALVYRLYELIAEHRADLAELITLEGGKPYAESLGEVAYGNSFVSWFAEEGKRSYGQTIPSLAGGSDLITIQQGVGVVAAITPWNFPLAMLTRKIAPALVAGCTVVLKPASQTPFTAMALAKLVQQAGFPKGVLNIITSQDSAAIGKELAENPLVRKLSFTGSTEVGSTLIAQTASTVKRLSMELGGNAPFIVFDDADIDKAVEGAMAGKFRNAGQTCVAVNRFYIQQEVYERFTEKLCAAVEQLVVGNGMDQGVSIGPLIHQKGLDKVQAHVEDARQRGAIVRAGGQSLGGLFYSPTVLTEIPHDARIAQEETFGPVCALFKFDSEQQAIELANNSPFGLSAYFYSQNIHRCQRVAAALEAGMIGINTGMLSNASAPFGGVKLSGMGREGASMGLSEYMEVKYLCFGQA